MSNERRLSHFDAWGLGDDSSKRRKPRIENLRDLERVRDVIGELNFNGVKDSIAFYAQHPHCRFCIFVFLTDDEIQSSPYLNPQEKSICLEMFREFEQGYVAWLGTRCLRGLRSYPNVGPKFLPPAPQPAYDFFWQNAHVLSHNRYDAYGFQGPPPAYSGEGSLDIPMARH